MSGTKIKICGLTRLLDAEAVNLAMPDYAGFVFYEKSRRCVSPEQARVLRYAIRPEIRTAGVFVDAALDTIADLYRDGVIDVIQLHGSENEDAIAQLKKMLPGAQIWQAIRVRTTADLIIAAGSAADMVLLDNGGGTGECFDWSLAVDFPRPFVLAGGLTPETIPDAVVSLRPWAVDLSSGVETDGVKDAQKIFAAVSAARRV